MFLPLFRTLVLLRCRAYRSQDVRQVPIQAAALVPFVTEDAAGRPVCAGQAGQLMWVVARSSRACASA